MMLKLFNLKELSLKYQLNVKCSNTLIKQYINFTSHKEIPYCKECAKIIRCLPKNKVKKTLAQIRPDLKKYYHAIDNQGIAFEDISRGSGKKIFLRCDACNKLQNEQHATVPAKYTFIKKQMAYFIQILNAPIVIRSE